MKKTLSLILSALMVAGMTTAAAAWEKGVDYIVLEEVDPDNCAPYGDAYPGSLDWDWPECTSGTLLKGTIIAGVGADGSHCWSNGTDNASKAFDGDTSTFFDPFAQNATSWAGVILDQAYELTEVRIMPRESFLDRMKGAIIQGSNDGEKWVDIVHITQEADGADYHIFTPAPVTDQAYIDAGYTDYSQYWVGSGSYSMYRYIHLDEEKHGDTADIELYGVAKEATEVTDDMVTVVNVSDINTFYEDVETTDVQSVSVDGSIVGTVIGGGGAYSDTASYACAWDNDPTTFYDPAAQTPKCWTGIQTAEPYVVTEVRVMPREGQWARTDGAHVQGSNDGKTWVDLAVYTAEDCIVDSEESPAVQAFISKTVEGAAAYTYFRYANEGTQHGDVADVLLFGTTGEAAPVETEAPETEAPETEAPETEAPETEATETEAPETEAPETVATPAAEKEEAPETFDAGIIAAAAAVVSAAGYAIARKRK